MERLTQEVLDRLYRPVGEIVVQWAMIDHSLHHLAFAMFQHLNTTPRAYGWPHYFGARLERLFDMFKKHPEFASLAKDAREILKDVEDHQRLRDMLAHGVAVRYHREKDGVVFHRIDRTTKKQQIRKPEITHVPSRMLVTFENLQRASANCTTLATGVLAIQAAVRELPRKKID